jgi:hypothetical protein
MEEQKRGLNQLIEFLEFAKTNGYFNAKTADNRIRVVKDVFDKVPNVDSNDVTNLDIDEIFRRYTVLTTNKLTSVSLQTNKAHLKSAIREFEAYLADPMHYRPKSGKPKRDTSPKPQTKKPPTAKKPPKAETAGSEVLPLKQDILPTPSLHIDIQVHISPQSSDTQIDKVFESMAKHLKDLYKHQSN